jgi:tripartite ATP-independent transporter DctM subunit
LNPVALLFVTFFVLIFLRLPVAYALTLASLLIIVQEGLRADLVVQQMFQGLNSFTLLAVPFFLLAGQLLNSGLITDRLMRLAEVTVGWIRGGLAHINIVVSMIFAGMSGSSTADTAGVGAVIIPAMYKRGFDRRFTVALTAASSTMGSIIPPSIMMVVYGAQGGVSIGGLFLAGAIPGALIGVGLMIYSYFYAVKRGLPAEAAPSVREFAIAWKEGLLPLLVPVIIIGGVLTGKFTATESGMVATVYVLFLMFVFYRSAKLSALPRILSDAAVLYSQPLLAVAAASVFGWLLAYFQAPQMIVGPRRRPGREPGSDPARHHAHLHHRRHLHGRHPGDHHLHADRQSAHGGERHQSDPWRHHRRHDPGPRPDHPALRPLPALGIGDRQGLGGQRAAAHPGLLCDHHRHHRDDHHLPRDRPLPSPPRHAAIRRGVAGESVTPSRAAARP